MPVRVLICVWLIVAFTLPAAAKPFAPSSDGEVLERLPFTPSDPLMRELRVLRRQLSRQPDNLSVSLRLARAYIELGRTTGDPRYAGYAQAALAPWWGLREPSPEVLVLRATLRQRMHEFDAALADLAAVLRINPSNAQARLTRATVLQVQGASAAAMRECRALQALTHELLWTACLMNVAGATGKLSESYASLRASLDRYPSVPPELRSWVLTSLAEMAARAGMAREAQAHFREALALDAADHYLLGTYADFLLDQARPNEVVALLQDKTRADPLLLRYALALKAQASKQLPNQVEQLRARFEASRLRGDRVHLREEARFTLHLLDEPKVALRLAEENWQVQKEPADVRILLEAALAAHDPAAVRAVKEWLANSGLQDVQVSRLVNEARHPT
jgi:predicted Zn-dependent protease